MADDEDEGVEQGNPEVVKGVEQRACGRQDGPCAVSSIGRRRIQQLPLRNRGFGSAIINYRSLIIIFYSTRT
jgi:hypothetical protein